tara:strand:- start:2670 stop:2876 length:207 start_codon:yes stop_codon:yes gene_type:complete
MAFRFEFNVKPRRGIIQLVIERDDKLLCLDLTPEEVATLNTKSGFAYQILDDYDQDELDQYNRNMEVH